MFSEIDFILHFVTYFIIMADKIPLEIINLICSYRERHPIMDIMCCWRCGTNDFWHMYVYHRLYSKSQKFEIICPDCNYDMCKD